MSNHGLRCNGAIVQDSEKARIVGDLRLQKRLKLTQCRGELNQFGSFDTARPQRALDIPRCCDHESALRKSDLTEAHAHRVQRGWRYMRPAVSAKDGRRRSRLILTLCLAKSIAARESNGRNGIGQWL